jgi:hypothetical protein
MTHPYEDLCHLLREYQLACDAMDDTGALKAAMQIRAAAQQLVVAAAKNANPTVDPRQMELGL